MTHRGYRPMLCVEVLEARLALSANPVPAVEPPAAPVAAEVGPEPVPVGTDEVIYTISAPPRQCMCASCLGTWDGPPRSSTAPEPAAPPAGDPSGSPEVAASGDRTGAPDVISQPAAAPAAGPVALPPAPTVSTWQAPEVTPPRPVAEGDRAGASDQIVVPAAAAEAGPTGDQYAPPAAAPEVDDLALVG